MTRSAYTEEAETLAGSEGMPPGTCLPPVTTTAGSNTHPGSEPYDGGDGGYSERMPRPAWKCVAALPVRMLAPTES